MVFPGDPAASWSILLEASLREAPDPSVVAARMSRASAEFPNLGPAAVVLRPSDWDGARTEFADGHYRVGDPLVRVALAGGSLMIAAHHGAVDGLGLLALLGIALDESVGSSATGVALRRPNRPYLLNALDRVREAVWTPPARIEPTIRGNEYGDHLVSRALPVVKLGSARLTSAALAATRKWNATHGAAHGRVVAAIGASWRGGADPRPEADSALLRLRLPAGATEDDVRALLTAATPEAGFPNAHNPLAQWGMRLLASRLGSTFLVSNLGVVKGNVSALRFFPAASGRSGVAFGVVTTGEATTATVRARRRDFDAAAAGVLLDLLCDAVLTGHQARR
ncbi:hypothetical protein SAMN04488074_102141 [Lentzea albidocapillata subsp. violacea]|uniref:Condensation domain-containing protein n=1 Tax=Lentzea albidocapillata subsp. violacea TaxID=128104 RepID=A0A1G8U0I5_9PSEU|nr:hypothetical protein [Lentzea albidocapillata]SDJ47134.1 hypothetical protein SAMN04488074_102141 [Lentzea albidocapillata subsp. violacea]